MDRSLAPHRVLRRHTLPLVTALVVTGCVTGRSLVVPTESDFPKLERQVASDSTDVEALVQLGAGYREAGRLEEAVDLLEVAARIRPDDGAAVLFLGLTYEDLGRYSDAGQVYEGYLGGNGVLALRTEVEDRIPMLRRRELQIVTAQALLDEAALRSTVPDARAVAVFPFLYTGASQDYGPLGHAVSAMLVTDLAQTDRLTVVERLQVQLLLDEIALGATDLVDTVTAARGGFILGAGNIVQGVIGGDETLLTLEAAVVKVAEGTRGPDPDVSEEDVAERLFDMEKRAAFAIYESLGIELTVAERERVNRRWTDNIQALLEFGRGLGAESNGDFALAAQHYRRAAAIDPAFAQASDRAEPAERLGEASTTSTQDLADGVASELMVDPGYNEFVDLAQVLEGAQTLVPTAENRDPVAEATGQEGFRPGILNVRIRRPGGGEQ